MKDVRLRRQQRKINNFLIKTAGLALQFLFTLKTAFAYNGICFMKRGNYYMSLYIKVGSITNAQRSAGLLRSSGYRPKIVRIEKPEQEDGCGYAVEVNANGNEPVNILKKNGINIRGVEEK